MNKKLIVVVGGTGDGAGLVRAILEDRAGGFDCRLVTRKPDSPAVQAFASQGADIATADLDDEGSLVRAFDGAYGAFCMTHFWERFSAELEVRWAGNLARAAKAAGVQHAIWSTAEDSRRWIPLDDDRMPTLEGRFKVPPFDGKAEGNRFFIDLGVPTTLLLTSSLFGFLLGGAAPRRGPDGVLTIMLPAADAKVPSIDQEDIGRCAYGIFKAGDQYIGRTVGIAAEHLSYEQLAERLTRALGEEVRYVAVPPDVFRAQPFPGADVLGNMFQFVAEASADLLATRDPRVARQLNPSLKTLDAWLAANKDRIPVEPAKAHALES